MRHGGGSACAMAMALLSAACGGGGPTAPTAPAPAPTGAGPAIVLEAEAGTGDGDLHLRTRASGGKTIHLAPGQRRHWTFTVGGTADYDVAVTYANDNPGDTETLRIELDGRTLGTFKAQDTGDDGAGWEIFVAELAGSSGLGGGSHTLVVESSGGDGCIEIDYVTLRRAS